MSPDDRNRPGPDFGPGSWPDDGVAVIAGVVIETLPGQGPFVARRLEEREGLDIVGSDGDHRLAAVWTAPSGKALESAVEDLVRSDEDILGVFPTFVGRDEEDDEARSGALRGISTESTGEAE